jgi:hypothetical protein
MAVVLLLVAGLATAAFAHSSHGGAPSSAPTTSAPTPTATGDQQPSPAAAAGSGVASTGPLVPTTGAYLGAVAESSDLTQQGRINSVLSLEKDMGRRLGIVHVYHQWNDSFPSSSDQYFLSRGSTLMVSWAGTDTRLIASGAEDATIQRWAASVKAVDATVFLEWRWEMDRPNLRAQTWSGPDYIKAWDHIRDIFAAAHVTNAAWVWCPTAAGFQDGRAQAFYPGDSRVDWICADAYAVDSMQPLSQLLKAFLDWAHSHPKPVMIGEFGAEERGPQQRAAWLREAGSMVKSNPQIKALVYFDYDSLEHARLFRWSLESSPSALAAFVALGRDPAFRAGS